MDEKNFNGMTTVKGFFYQETPAELYESGRGRVFDNHGLVKSYECYLFRGEKADCKVVFEKTKERIDVDIRKPITRFAKNVDRIFFRFDAAESVDSIMATVSARVAGLIS